MSFQKRWGHLTVIRREKFSLKYKTPKGIQKPLARTAEIWVMHCDCGIEFDLDSRLFPGRKVMRSCGNVSCPYSTSHTSQEPTLRPGGRPRREEPCVPYSAHLPVRIMAIIDTYMELRNRTRKVITKREAIIELIQAGWGSLKVKDEDIEPPSPTTPPAPVTKHFRQAS